MPFLIKQGDTRPNLPFKFWTDSTKTVPLDLSTATSVSIVIRSTADQVLLFKKVCTITDAAIGEGFYDWVTGDTATSGGFEFEFEIIWNNGDVQTVPADSYFALTILDDIG